MRTVPPHVVDFTVRGFDCGYGGPLRVLPLMNFLQEAAGGHAEALGLGMSSLRATGLTWMLSRLDMRAAGLPRAGQAARVETWPAGTERLFALRDFVLRGADGAALLGAVYAYIVVDAAARRPVRPERLFGEDEPRGEGGHPVEGRGFDIPGPAAPPVFSFAQRASSRHLDDNGHVNNAHLVDWLADAPPASRRGSGELAALRVEFSSEVLEGDELEVLWGEPAGPVPGFPGVPLLSELRRGGKTVAKALSAWS